MDTSKELERRSLEDTLIGSRVVAAFLILLSAWSLYSNIRHASARFQIPHNLVMQREPFGGWAIDLFVYIGFAVLLIGFVTSTRDRVEMALFIGLFGSTGINPARMLVPQYTSAIWWVELCLTFVFFVTSITVFWRLIRRPSTPGTPPSSDQMPQPASK